MSTYTNPAGFFSATDGDDVIIVNTAPVALTNIDALGGRDSLSIQFEYAFGLIYDIKDASNTGTLTAGVSLSPYSSSGVQVQNVESVEIHGTANYDTFHLQLGTSVSGLGVTLDGGAGQDVLFLDWSKQSAGLNFVVNGAAIASSWGSFANFETFEIHTGSGNDTITTGAANDQIYTGTGVDNVNAGAGNDQIDSQSSGGLIDGGDGIDIVSISFRGQSTPVTLSIAADLHIANGLSTANVEGFNIGGSNGNDNFVVSRSEATVYGDAGYDTLTYTAPGTDPLNFYLDVYNGDQLNGNVGYNFRFDGFENLSVTGTQFNDQFRIGATYAGQSNSSISFEAGAGIDILLGDFSHFIGATSFTVGSDGSVASNRGQFTGFENFGLTGGAGADVFITGSGDDTLEGGGGADRLDGGAGNDTLRSVQFLNDDDGAADILIGGAGNDVMLAGYGDAVDGGSGSDTLYYTATSATAGITANFASLVNGGTITIGGATLSGIELIGQVTGTSYSDTIIGGGSGSQTLSGADGDDRIIGGAASDTIRGDNGNDTLTGGAGADTLFGGVGHDTFTDTAAGLNGDTVDMTLDDRIVLTDANFANFAFNYSGNVLTYTGGSLNISSQVVGRIVASAAAGGGVQLQIQLPPVATIDQIASQLTTGYWSGTTHRWPVTQGGTITVDIHALTATEQTLARTALAEWTDIIGVNFQEVSSSGQITFDHSEASGGPIAATDSVYANGIISSAHIQISSSWLSWYGSRLDSYGFQTYVHEIGHALGLGHAGNYNDIAAYAIDAMYSNDSYATTVMSYFDQGEAFYFANLHHSILTAATPMQADIAAMQSLYGLSATTRVGDTIYGDYSNAGPIYDDRQYGSVALTIIDSGGTDTIVYQLAGTSQLINLNPETFSNVNGYTGNLSIARGSIIENAIGGNFGDKIIGNSVDNVLTGGGGTDVLTGGEGNDTFKDTAVGHNGDVITDFSPGDRILISDANFADFAFSLVGDQLYYTGGSMRVADFHNMQLRATAAADGGVQFVFPSGPPIVIGVGAVTIDRGLGAEVIGMKDEARNPAAAAIEPSAEGSAQVPLGFPESLNPWHFASSDLLALA